MVYPPVSPYDPPFHPPARPVRPIRALAIAVVVTLGVGALVDVFSLVVTFERLSLVSGLIDSPDSVDISAVETNDSWYALCGVVDTAAYVLTGVVFVVWLYRARSNAEAITPIAHRRSKSLLIFGWIIPIASLWLPKQVVDDIWVTSTPQDPPLNPRHPTALEGARHSGLVWAWWLTWLIAFWGAGFFYRAARGDDLGSELLAVRTEIYFAIPVFAATVLAALVVMRITQAQEARRAAAVPWG
ncbi:DUF4328 domain-containing protein [Streptosporangium sp. NPDC051022]|uniref:DUF4328 domain-containing protein n=1 Tax=Streptosporangium sp. NPDC051022 TaxID=3155752 RepID=UPI00342E1B73